MCDDIFCKSVGMDCPDVVQLRTERDLAIRLLAEWCVDIQDKGSEWDNWDENFKDAAYRPHPLRALIDEQMALYRSE